MLPINHAWKEGSRSDLLQTTPRMALATQDIEHLVEELRAYHAIYSPLFQRREPRDAAHTYLQGLLATLPRQSIEPMVLAVEDVAPKAVRAMQAFMSEGPWHDERLLHRHWEEVHTDLGADDGVLMVDGSDVPKQGGHSVGVKRQSAGNWASGPTARLVYVWARSVPRATPCWTVDGICLRPGAQMTRMRNGAGSAAFRPASPSKPSPSWPRRCSRGGQEPGAAMSLGGGGRGVWEQSRLAGWRGGAGSVVCCRSAPPYAGLGRAPSDTHPIVAWARSAPAAGAPGRRGARGADRPGGGGGACPPRRGHARRSRKAARDLWSRSVPLDGWLPYGTPCQGRRLVGAAAAGRDRGVEDLPVPCSH